MTPLYGNLAAVASSMKDWPACVEQCDKVLRKDADNVKALYRKGVALGRTKDFDEAIQVLKKAVQLDATNVASKRALRDVVQAKKTQQKQMKQTYGGMFSKLEGFASSNRPKEPRKVDDYDDLSDEDYDLAKPGAAAASRRVEAPSRHRHASSPGEQVVACSSSRPFGPSRGTAMLRA